MGFFNIGKANARIEALEAELAQAAASANASVSATAETLKSLETLCEELKAKCDAETSAHAETKAALAKANADLISAQSEVAGIASRIESAASAKALQIAAAAGVPPIPNLPTPTPGASTPDMSKLSGRDRVVAAFRNQNLKNQSK